MKFTLCLIFVCSFSSLLFAQEFQQQPFGSPFIASNGLDGLMRGQVIIETDTGYMLIQPQEFDPQRTFDKIYQEVKMARDEACNTPYYNDLHNQEMTFPSTTHQLKVHENHPLRVVLNQDPKPRQFKTTPSILISFENYRAHRPAKEKVKINTLMASNSSLVENMQTLNGVLVPINMEEDHSGRSLEHIPLTVSNVIRALHEETKWCLSTHPVKETVDLEIKVNVSSSNFYLAMKNLVQAHTFKGLLCQTPYAFTFQGLRHELKSNTSLDMMFDTSLSRQVCTTKSKRICESIWIAGVRVTKCGNISVPHIYVEKMASIDLTANIAIEGDISYKVSGNSMYLPTYGDTIELESWRTILTGLGVPYSDGWITDSKDGPSFTLSYRVDSLLKHDAQILAGVIKAEMKRLSIGGLE